MSNTALAIANLEGYEEGALSAMSTRELREELLNGLRVTASCLSRLAMVVKELEGRGDDLSDLKIAMLTYLRLIASGQLLPEAVVRFVQSPRLMAIVASLTIKDQRALSEGKPVPLVVYGPTGDTTHRMVDPLNLVTPQIAQVFARGKIRTEAEQLVILDQRRTEAKRKPAKVGQLRLDRERGGVTVGKRFIPLIDLVAAVQELRKQ